MPLDRYSQLVAASTNLPMLVVFQYSATIKDSAWRWDVA
jgi:hypothetical protein